MRIVARNLLTSISLLAATAVPTAARAEGEGWDWYIAPYAWVPSMSVDLETPRGSTGADVDFFSDIIDKIEGVFLGHVEGQGDHFGVFGDLMYVGLGESQDFDRASTNSDMDMVLIELAAVYSFSPERYEGLDVFGGLRYIDMDFEIDVDPVNPAVPTVGVDAGDSFSDFMLGARYTARFSDKWSMNLRGDGSWGDTEGTWSASAMFHRRTGNGAWVFGYRYLDAEFEPGQNTVDIAMYGPVVGYAFAL